MISKHSHKGVEEPGHRLNELITWLCVGFLVVLVLPSNLVSAQQGSPVKSNEIELARRARAADLIVETADAARTFKDLFYRARIQTLAADTLWSYDEPRARAIFRRAWEAATAYDKSEQEAEDRESGVPSTLPITEARDEVLTKVATRDSKLAETFLLDLLTEKSEQKDVEKDQTETQRRTPWRELSATGLRRLALAYEMLGLHEPARAAEIIAPVINEGASGDLIVFILRLREQSATHSDALYSRLLEKTRTDPRADANDVLLLSAPIVSHRLLVVVDGQGALQFRPVQLISPNVYPAMEQSARNSFYGVALDILMRPVVPRRGQNMTPESIALYFAIGRLLPFFERESPQNVAGLRLRFSTLANDVDAGRRDNLDSQIALTSLTPERPGDVLRPQLDQLGRARDTADRDRIALGIVKKAAQKRLWDRARRAALEIEDVDSRRSALSYIAVSQIADLSRAFADDKEENFDGLAKFVRNADVPRLATAWGLAQIAIMAKRKGDMKGATALLDEAVTFAARTPAGTWQRVAAYTAVARMAVQIDVKRAWEILPEIAYAANALDDYAGDEESIDIEIGKNNTEEELEPLSVGNEVFQVDGLFAAMAQVDYEKALTAARSIGRETPRAFASLAIARVMLNTGLRTQDSGLRMKG